MTLFQIDILTVFYEPFNTESTLMKHFKIIISVMGLF